MEIITAILHGLLAIIIGFTVSFTALSLCLILVYLIAVIATHLMYKWFGDR